MSTTGNRGDLNKVIDGKFESVYLNSTEKIFDALNQVSPSFCLAKWYNVSLHIPTGRTHSCYHPSSHHIPLEEIKIDVSALHNTKYKKEQRKKMLLGERPAECNFCWEIEDSGGNLSDRAYRSKDVWRPNLIKEAIAHGDAGNPKPRYVEVNFNQACNFRCSYCSPHLSTAWMTDVERHGPFTLANRTHNDIVWMKNKNMVPDNSPDNPYLLAFWEWFPTIYADLHTFRMTGGEPLMDKNTFKVFEYVKQNPKKDLHLSITSNCCPPGEQWSKFISGLKEITDADAIDHFMLFCSLDNWGARAEYIRNGLNFDVMLSNIKQFLTQGNKHSLTFIITFNALSYIGFVDYLENILNLRKEYNTDRQLIWFDVPQLTDPDFLNPKILKKLSTELLTAIDFMESNKESSNNQFKGFKDFEISKVQRLYDWINSNQLFDQPLAMKNFYLFFREYDRRHGTDFTKVFPELKDFWKECENLNE